MKCLVIFLLAIGLPVTAIAELQFPEYGKQSKEVQAIWGYEITRTKGKERSLNVIIPPKAAKAYAGARLSIRDRKGRLFYQDDVTPKKKKDGSLVLAVSLAKFLEGEAELIIYTGYVAGGAPLQEVVLTPNFGGFTIKAKIESQD